MLLAAPVQAQALSCAPRADILARLADTAQSRRAIGLTGRAVMELFSAPDSAEWTLTLTLPDGRMCVLAVGTAFDAPGDMFPARGVAL
ncbi:hypothetical protein [Roseinatronobacter sp. NSM]|uniref:hypothetical protein n=1 Tax=Roseinatronobacter sp. NSM TaxID=3457785 RepID=UPI004035F8C6